MFPSACQGVLSATRSSDIERPLAGTLPAYSSRSLHRPAPLPLPETAKDTMRAAGDWAILRLFGPGGSGPMRHIEQTEAARDGAVVFIALELSKSAWLVAAQGSPSGKTSLYRLD